MRHSLVQLTLTLLLLTTAAFTQVVIRRSSDGIRDRPKTRLDGSPGSPDGAYDRADSLRKAGKNEEALAAIDTAIYWDRECGKCFGLRSGINFNLGNYKQGISDGYLGEERSELPRDKAMSAYNKGLNMARLDRSAEAVSVFDDCIRYDETYGFCFFGKGKTLVELGHFRDSLPALETATELMPQHGPSWSYKAFALGGVGRFEESLATGDEAVALASGDPRSFLARGYANAVNAKYAEALADATRALEIDPYRPNAHLLAAQALQGLGRHEEAAKEFELEPNKAAVEAVLHPQLQVNGRLYNCGDDSTDLPSLSDPNSYFDRCKERIIKQLEESTQSAQPTKPKRKPLSNVRTVVPNRKK